MKTTTIIYALGIGLALCACSGHQQPVKVASEQPTVTDNGQLISFPTTKYTGFFKTEVIQDSSLNATYSIPAHIAAIVVESNTGGIRNVVLFEVPDLAMNYSALIQHQINIGQLSNVIQQRKVIVEQNQAIVAQKKLELERFQDLAAHGVGTGKEVSDAQTELLVAEADLMGAQTEYSISQTDLANERAAIIEHEAALKSAGFDTADLLKATAGKVYVSCDIPESQINKIKVGTKCKVTFNALPGQVFTGTISGVADVIDNMTRMVKVRVEIANKNNLLKAGMFGNLSLGIVERDFISVPSSALITVQGKNYAFIKKDSVQFERRAVTIGEQINDQVIILSGLSLGDTIVTEGAMQLKGLSFGY